MSDLTSPRAIVWARRRAALGRLWRTYRAQHAGAIVLLAYEALRIPDLPLLQDTLGFSSPAGLLANLDPRVRTA